MLSHPSISITSRSRPKGHAAVRQAAVAERVDQKAEPFLGSSWVKAQRLLLPGR